MGLNRFPISEKWLQTHLEVIEDALLVGFGGGDFLEFHPGQANRLAPDGRQPFDHVAQGPLPRLVRAVRGKPECQPLLEVSLQVIGRRAPEDVTLDALIGLVVNRAHERLGGALRDHLVAEGGLEQLELEQA